MSSLSRPSRTFILLTLVFSCAIAAPAFSADDPPVSVRSVGPGPELLACAAEYLRKSEGNPTELAIAAEFVRSDESEAENATPTASDQARSARISGMLRSLQACRRELLQQVELADRPDPEVVSRNLGKMKADKKISERTALAIERLLKGDMLVLSSRLPEASVFEIPRDAIQAAQAMPYWHGNRAESPMVFVKGVKLISVPGMGPAELREANEQGARYGISLPLADLQAGRAEQIPSAMSQARIRRASAYRLLGPSATYFNDSSTPGSPRDSAPAPAIEPAFGDALRRIERGRAEVENHPSDFQVFCHGPQAGFHEAWLRAGVPPRALSKALEYFEANRERIGNQHYITINDFTAPSSEERMYILDLRSGEVRKFHVSHGTGSDPQNTGYAHSFSDQNGSNATPRGFLLATTQVDSARAGLAVKLVGQEPQNRSTLDRGVLLHGSDAVRPEFAKAYGHVARSFGCAAVDDRKIAQIAAMLAGGSLFYNYAN